MSAAQTAAVSADDLISGAPTRVGRGRVWTDAPSNGHRGRALTGRPGLGLTEADPIEHVQYQVRVSNGAEPNGYAQMAGDSVTPLSAAAWTVS